MKVYVGHGGIVMYFGIWYHSCRFDTHMMMSLAHGKVTESSARLVLAERLLKVGVPRLFGGARCSLGLPSLSEYQ